jgi:Na+/melibiose symporter-like transporter
VIYGFINAGQHGWGAPVTWLTIAAGVILLAGFVTWERRSSHPLIELSLFGNGQFSWGTVHATIANFALFGLLFAVPQFFQSVHGASPLGTGLRLLPMIGGILVGSQTGSRLVKRFGSRTVIAAGFILAAIALGAAATTRVSTGYGFAAAWIAILGLGIGLVLPAAMGGALGALSAERAGAGSGLMQALRQVGGTVGVAILGTVLSAGYRDRLRTGQLSPAQGHAAHDSVAAGIQVASQLHDGTLAQAVRVAFVHGMDLTLIVSGALVLAGAVLALLFLPRRTRPAAGPAADARADAEQDAEQSVP